VEIGGGSVRVHDATMQEHIFSKILQVGLFDGELVLLINFKFMLTFDSFEKVRRPPSSTCCMPYNVERLLMAV
jgi:aspartyl-tRNA synthetase